ncbi:MAG: ABC transporter permease [Thaumarchaeota archaeon]|nr:ABC transporter permease [Nitrososphaerota archaeon]
MSNVSSSEIKREFVKSKIGLIGIGILASLIILSMIAIITIPIDTFKQWNNPGSWISYPKTSVPVWVNYFTTEKIPEHLIMDKPTVITKEDIISLTSHQFSIQYHYDDFPSDFIYEFNVEYSGSQLLQISVIRPDQSQILLLSRSLPHSDSDVVHHERIFSADNSIKKNIQIHFSEMDFYNQNTASEDMIFADRNGKVLKGDYIFLVNIYGIDKKVSIIDSKLILGGKAYGMMGTDELRRDLAVGLLWGTPLALFIGIAVAIGSVISGLIYGVYSGFKGKKTDEAMMRFNDVIYALPALPFLIILAVTISNSIFLLVGFLMIFGWVGIAKVSRSMALQIKTRQYVEASQMMGQKNSKIVFKHIIPQLLPYAFASIAISVPAAITTEAGISFLGLGDPTFPTWGQILHDANTYGAAARGLWWWIAPPGIMIAITGLAFVFIGNALDAIVNPKLKK